MKAAVSRSRIDRAAFEAESHTSNGHHAIGHAYRLELLAEATDGDVQRLGRAVPVLVPHVRHQPAPGDDLVPAGGEDVQHLELLARQGDLVLSRVDAAGVDVDAQARLGRVSGAGTGGGRTAQ